jgi:hypothetical protein
MENKRELKPRCTLYKNPMFLSADKKLKPCCFLNPHAEWKIFKEWGEERGLDISEDLDIIKYSRKEIFESATWKGLLESFKTNDAPYTCYKECGHNSYTSDTMTAKHSQYKQTNNKE